MIEVKAKCSKCGLEYDDRKTRWLGLEEDFCSECANEE
jgi:hypothetical protein